MAWIMDTVSMHRGHSVPGVVTGKPIAVGGSVGRADATGQGAASVIADAARRGGFELAGSRVAIQGFGNVGDATARLLHEAGARVVAITDLHGGVADADGPDVPFLRRHLAEHGTIAGAPGTRPIGNDELFALEVDVLVLAALDGQIRPRTRRRSEHGSWPKRRTAPFRPTRTLSCGGTVSSSCRTSCAVLGA